MSSAGQYGSLSPKISNVGQRGSPSSRAMLDPSKPTGSSDERGSTGRRSLASPVAEHEVSDRLGSRERLRDTRVQVAGIGDQRLAADVGGRFADEERERVRLVGRRRRRDADVAAVVLG